jgi:hypothetical protein
MKVIIKKYQNNNSNEKKTLANTVLLDDWKHGVRRLDSSPPAGGSE